MPMKAINRKMLRDLVHLRGQVLAISLVMACGVATFVLSVSTLQSLEGTFEAYYERSRFADVFAHLKRAPNALAQRLAEIPGVARLETRVVATVTLDMQDLDEPAVGRLISLPEPPGAALNDLHLRAGRFPAPAVEHEVLVSEAFALAHGLAPPATVTAVMNGRLERLRITGVALSPEHIYQIREGEILPDDLRFGVFWMPRRPLAAAFDMEGAFNDLLVKLMPGASEADVIARIDRLTADCGGLGAYGREDHMSHKYLSNEIRELEAMTRLVPAIFLSVAAFLLNVVLSRLIGVQREEIAALKALGYSRRQIAWHYAQMVMVIVAAGAVLGTISGAWMGSGVTRMYTRFFHFPIFEYRLHGSVVALALGVSGVAALVGAFSAVRGAVRLPPAEAMRPQPPARYRPTLLERIGLGRFLSPAARMILRQLERRPVRALLSCIGIALAVAILVLGSYMEDAVYFAMHFEFEVVQRHDLSVTFVEPAMPRSLTAIQELPGVRHAEPFRAVAARLRGGQRSRRTGIMGLLPEGELFRLTDLRGDRVELPPEGMVLSEKLAEILDVRTGEEVVIEVLEGRRPIASVPVLGLVRDFAGLSAYMRMEALNRLMREGGLMSGAFIAAPPERRQSLYSRLKRTPQVAAVAVKEAALNSFRQTMAETILRMRLFNVAFAVVIAFGVVYNTARISLSERSRDLATLRVIGFSRREISLIQLGELAALTAAAIPLGLLLGYLLAALSTTAYDTELFRIPFVIDRSTHAFAAAVILIAAGFSGLVVRRMLDRLDLVAVLKSKE